MLNGESDSIDTLPEQSNPTQPRAGVDKLNSAPPPPSATLEESADKPDSRSRPRRSSAGASPTQASTSNSTGSAFGVGQYLEALSERDQTSLEQSVSRAIIYFLERDCAVWLEGLGIISGAVGIEEKSRIMGTSLIVRPETRRRLSFEKCNELVSFQREQFPALVETKQLAQRTFAILATHLQLRWSEAELTRVLRGLFRLIKNEVVTKGYSLRLKNLGDFLALHNRRGNSLSDWYAGADIFLLPKYRQVIKVGQARVFPRPQIESAWEWLSAAYGAPITTFETNITTELLALGFSLSAEEHRWALENNRLRVAVFKVNNETSKAADGASRLIYCTDGLRFVAAQAANRKRYATDGRALGKSQSVPSVCGTELTFQLDVNNRDISISSAPHWPARALTMGWIMVNRQQGLLQPGQVYSCNQPILPPGEGAFADIQNRSLNAAVLMHQWRSEYRGAEELVHSKRSGNMTTIFSTEFAACRHPQLGDGVEFRLINLVGISNEEAKLVEQLSSQHLDTILRHRGLDQVTQVLRPSLLAGSHFEPPAEQTESATGEDADAKVSSAPIAAEAAPPSQCSSVAAIEDSPHPVQ